MSVAEFDPASAGHAVQEPDPGRVGVEVVGPLHHAAFPGLCVKCGAASDGTLPVTKLFYHSGENRSYHFTAGVAAPVCAGCTRTHERELRPIDPEVRRKLLRGWLVAALPYVLPFGISLWLLGELGPNLLDALREGTEPVEIAIWGAVCAFFGLTALTFYRLIMKQGRPLMLTPGHTSPVYLQVERGPLGSSFIVPAEPTSVQRALDFTDDRSELFDRERHRFTFENHEVAARFADLNAHREWDPASPRAQFAGTARRAAIGGVILLGIYLLLKDLLF